MRLSDFYDPGIGIYDCDMHGTSTRVAIRVHIARSFDDDMFMSIDFIEYSFESKVIDRSDPIHIDM